MHVCLARGKVLARSLRGREGQADTPCALSLGQEEFGGGKSVDAEELGARSLFGLPLLIACLMNGDFDGLDRILGIGIALDPRV